MHLDVSPCGYSHNLRLMQPITRVNCILFEQKKNHLLQTFAKISSSQPVNGEATLDRDRFHMFFDFVAKRPDVQQIYDR